MLPWSGAGRRLVMVASVVVAPLVMISCGGHGAASAPPSTTVPPPPTTITTLPLVSRIVAVGVRPGVSEPAFYPQVSLTSVTCGVFPKGGRFIRINLPAGGTGVTAKSVMTKPTAVIVAPGGAILIDPRYSSRVLYAESMPSVTTAKQGAFVLILQNTATTGGDGLTVVPGAVQVNGEYACPAGDVTYPGS